MGLLVVLTMLAQQHQEPSTAADWKAAGMAQAASGKLEAALPALQKACDLDPKDEDSCYYLARTLFTLDRWEKAREPFEKALKSASRPNVARVHRAIALNSMALGNTAEAERHFQRAVALHPGASSLREDPRVDYGSFLFRQGRLQDALPLLTEAAKSAPGSARAHTELGRVMLHLGKPGAAASSLEKAVSLDSRSSAARLLLGRAYLQLGRSEEGQKQLQLAGDSSTVK